MSDSPKQYSYQELMAQQEEVVRRARLMADRLGRMEFTGGMADADLDRAVTSVALFYVSAVQAAKSGIPLHLYLQALGSVYQIVETAAVHDLWEAIRNALLMRIPVPGQDRPH